ncbi:DUF3011 domain-containing protein [Luteimonas sp. SJ-92]|uniref:DUF3011 domain-containing protein n=1 Tax=Luteimonas salinisoli TaxID=2752307 RepID=A0A853JBC6_9GAMM|nr:DUF3011 domain-containing protein [Luteimonas salinisoli]NZA25928.1 DUF3011 domain-containing protein [Luteimonas salinisoli]
MRQGLRAAAVLTVALGCGGCAIWPGGADPPAGAANEAPTVLRCASRDNRRYYCQADTSRGVRLAQQLSTVDCVQGSTWGYDGHGVWVARGCRGEFLLGPGTAAGAGAQPPTLVRCESAGNRHRRCNAVVRSEVKLLRQLSRTRCVQRQNWGWDRGGVWVDGGCAAEFEVR